MFPHQTGSIRWFAQLRFSPYPNRSVCHLCEKIKDRISKCSLHGIRLAAVLSRGAAISRFRVKVVPSSESSQYRLQQNSWQTFFCCCCCHLSLWQHQSSSSDFKEDDANKLAAAAASNVSSDTSLERRTNHGDICVYNAVLLQD